MPLCRTLLPLGFGTELLLSPLLSLTIFFLLLLVYSCFYGNFDQVAVLGLLFSLFVVSPW